MRPCDKCGSPVSNSTRLCGDCLVVEGSPAEATSITSQFTENPRRSETAYVLSVLLFNGLGSLIAGSVFGLVVFAIAFFAIGLGVSTSTIIAVIAGCCSCLLILLATLTQGA